MIWLEWLKKHLKKTKEQDTVKLWEQESKEWEQKERKNDAEMENFEVNQEINEAEWEGHKINKVEALKRIKKRKEKEEDQTNNCIEHEKVKKQKEFDFDWEKEQKEFKKLQEEKSKSDEEYRIANEKFQKEIGKIEELKAKNDKALGFIKNEIKEGTKGVVVDKVKDKLTQIGEDLGYDLSKHDERLKNLILDGYDQMDQYHSPDPKVQAIVNKNNEYIKMGLQAILEEPENITSIKLLKKDWSSYVSSLTHCMKQASVTGDMGSYIKLASVALDKFDDMLIFHLRPH